MSAIMGNTKINADYDYAGCRIRYQGNTLTCVRHRTIEENYQTAMKALSLLLGYEIKAENFEKDAGMIEALRIYGGGKLNSGSGS